MKKDGSNKRRYYYLLIVLLCIFSVGCSSNNNSNSKVFSSIITDMETENDKESGELDIPISINILQSTKSSDDNYYCYDDVMSFIKASESEQNMFVEATSKFYNQYISGERFYAPTLESSPMNFREYLNVAVDIVNNTHEQLDIEELDFNVEKSSLDSIPYIFIYTSDLNCDMISFSNESHFNWGGFTFYYTILKKNEKFDGLYRKNCHIDYFENTRTIDLLRDLEELGLDINKLMRTINNSDDYDYDYSESLKPNDEYGGREICLYAYEDEDYIKYAEAFCPFDFRKMHDDDELRYPYRGYAKMYGKIVFDNYHKEIEFYTDIILSAPCGGAGAGENDHFDVKLKSQGENYLIRYPYTTTIEPYGSEMVSLSIKADKSSNHRFYISIKNGNKLNIRSKNVELHFMAPKHYYQDNSR